MYVQDPAFYRGQDCKILHFSGVRTARSCTVVRGCEINTKKANGNPSTDGMIIKALIEVQPRTVENLVITTDRNRRTIENRLEILSEMNMVKETSEEEWAFKNYNPLEETVRKAMENLLENGFIRFSSATVARVLNKQNPDLIGATPDEVAPIAWRLSSKLCVIMDEKAFFHNGHRVVF